MRLIDYIILAVISVWLIFAVWFIVHKAKNGGCVSCDGGCISKCDKCNKCDNGGNKSCCEGCRKKSDK